MMSVQAPISSGYGPSSTAQDVMQGIDLSGRIAIVTGGYSGLGKESVRALLNAGARVIVPARDVDRARLSLAECPGAEISELDLVDPASITCFSQRFLAESQSLAILLNNAGVMAIPELARDARGNELHFAINHLGHFQLTLQLWPALVAAAGARVISVSSLGHCFSPIIFDDINYQQRPYDPTSAYGQSKTANALFAIELDKRGREHGVRAFAVHPGGVVETNLVRHVPQEMLVAIGFTDSHGEPVIAPEKGLKTAAQGAATQLWCATSPALDGFGGVYCEDVDFAEICDRQSGATFDVRKGVLPYAIDHEAARRLWALSEQATGVALSV